MMDSIELVRFSELGAPTRPERSDAAANRALILATAERLFAEHGVCHVNMADIAEAAGVGKGTLYRRFANKAELCMALLDTQMREFQDAMLGRMRVQTAARVSYMEQLAQFLDSLVELMERHAVLLVEVQRRGLLDEKDNFTQPHLWLHTTISALLRGAIRAGEIPNHLDVEFLADALLAPLRADLFTFQRQGRGFSLERISGGMRSLLAGLASELNADFR
jgi:AcrR family transcriptional regulator